MGLVPDTGNADVAMAFLEGALKYGRFNWRVAGVRASIYNDAVRRHLSKWWNGQNRDSMTRVKHLANLRACVDILLDAEICGMLEDDRPPAMPMSEYIDSLQPHIQHLKQLFDSHSPPQYTQKDYPRDQTSIPPGMTYADVYGQPEPTVTGADHSRVAPSNVGTGIRPEVPAGTITPKRTPPRYTTKRR